MAMEILIYPEGTRKTVYDQCLENWPLGYGTFEELYEHMSPSTTPLLWRINQFYGADACIEWKPEELDSLLEEVRSILDYGGASKSEELSEWLNPFIKFICKAKKLNSTIYTMAD